MKNKIISLDELKKFSNKELIEKLKSNLNFSDDELASYELAFNDAFESFYKIYFELIPSLLKSENKERVKDLFEDIKGEFEHIRYHIKDAKLYNFDME